MKKLNVKSFIWLGIALFSFGLKACGSEGSDTTVTTGESVDSSEQVIETPQARLQQVINIKPNYSVDVE